MKKLLKALLSLSLMLAVLPGHSQGKSPYQIFNAKGKKVSYKKMLKGVAKGDVVFFGEQHNNAISHWLQLEVAKDLAAKKQLTFGAEMYERDNAEVLQRYMRDELDEKGLDTLARLWPNHKTDYAPLLQWAKSNNWAYHATNIPRRYANKVYRGDFAALDSLSAEEKSWIAPMPIAFDAELPQYQKIMEMMGDHASPKLVKAQAMKDATMAYYIAQNHQEDHLFMHLNGAWHSDFHEGILWYLNKYAPELQCMTISTVEQSDLDDLEEEHLNRADYIIVVDKDMTKTY